MIKKELTVENAEKLGGDGKGKAVLKHFLCGDELPAKAGLVCKIELEAGGSVGYHKHVGEGEMYYIIKGHGEYQENGETMPISEGMITMVYDGDSHGLQNSDDGVMEFLAFIIKE